jgi:hypothetical protein
VLAPGALHCELGDEQVEEAGEGAAAGCFGWAGKPGQFVRENDDVDDAESKIEALLECRHSGLGTKSDVMPKKDRAGDMAIEWVGVPDLGGNVGEAVAGICTSFRTTIRERCNRRLASRSEA